MQNLAKVLSFSVQSTAMPPRKKKYADDRRKHLTKEEVETLAESAKTMGRHGQRDALMIRAAYWHGLRAAELVGLRKTAINLSESSVAITRRKNGKSGNQPMVNGEERKAWIAWLKRDDVKQHEFVFEGERGPLKTRAFFKIVERAAIAAGFEFDVTPHSLRHATGYVLTNNGINTRLIQDMLGHKEIRHTVAYTALAPNALSAVKDIL